MKKLLVILALLFPLTSFAAVNFNGSTQCITTPDVSTRATTALTITGWVKSTTNSGFHTMFGEGNGRGGTGSYDWGLIGYGDTQNPPASGAGFYFQIRTTATAGPATAIRVGSSFDSNWHYLTGTWDGATMKSYYDGVFSNSTAIGGTELTGSDGFNIGCGDTSANALTEFTAGDEADVRVYNRALSPQEIRALYAGSRIDNNGLLGWWPLWGVGTSEVNLFGRAGAGTLVGFTTPRTFRPTPPQTSGLYW